MVFFAVVVGAGFFCFVVSCEDDFHRFFVVFDDLDAVHVFGADKALGEGVFFNPIDEGFPHVADENDRDR